ncbi:MAG: DUF4302 domain-containing protein [Clostridium sp.]|nr:DUF4302 domain-containing protein [Clostridium sp.]
MKKFMIYAAAACLAGGSFVACTPEEDDLFDQSSAERLNATIPQYTDLLCSAENGWVMEYFVNNDWEPGYTYLMKFNKDTSVKMAGDNVWIGGKYIESTSVFEVITDDGPVLTFNTYNPIFHIFAAPDDLNGNGAPADINESGYGHRGDYEFIIMKSTDDLITLKGKKWGLTILLRRMPAGVEWESYLEDLKDVKSRLFGANAPEVVLTAGSERYVMDNASSGSISFYPENGDALTETTKVPYIVTSDGIRLVKPFKGTEDKGSFAVQTFVMSEKGLVCVDAGQNAAIMAYAPAHWLMDQKKSWVVDGTDLGGVFDVAYKEFAAKIKPKYKALRTINLVYDRSHDNSFAFNWVTSSYTGNRYGELKAEDDNTIRFEFSGEGDANGNTMYNNVPAIGAFMDLLQAVPFRVEYIHPLDASRIKFTSSANAEDYFYVTLK